LALILFKHFSSAVIILTTNHMLTTHSLQMKCVHPYVSIKLETMITTSLYNLNVFSAAKKLFMQYNVALLSLILTEWLFQWVLSSEHCEQTAVLVS